MNNPSRLTFAWWNFHDFVHFDPTRTASDRWPKQLSNYKGKRDRILKVLPHLLNGPLPDLIAVCEITREAADDLATRLSNEFDPIFPVSYPNQDRFQVAVCY